MSAPTPEQIAAAAAALRVANIGWCRECDPDVFGGCDDCEQNRIDYATTALTAAAPLMEAHAKAEAIREAAEECEYLVPRGRAYRWFIARAETIEGNAP